MCAAENTYKRLETLARRLNDAALPTLPAAQHDQHPDSSNKLQSQSVRNSRDEVEWPALERVGLRRLRLDDFRHTYAA
jgi:hypothetical protein